MFCGFLLLNNTELRKSSDLSPGWMVTGDERHTAGWVAEKATADCGSGSEAVVDSTEANQWRVWNVQEGLCTTVSWKQMMLLVLNGSRNSKERERE